MNFILSQQGLIIPHSDAMKYFGSDMQKFLNKLIIKTKVKVGPPKIARLYKNKWIETTVQKGNKMVPGKTQILHIPRFYLKNMMDAGTIANVEIMIPAGRELSASAREFAAELENNQSVVVNNLMENVFNRRKIAEGLAGCTLNLGAGRGKTFIAASIISRVGKAALYFIPLSSILSQIMEAMQICFPNAVVGYYGDMKEEAKKAAQKEVKAAAKATAAASTEPKKKADTAAKEALLAAINKRADEIFREACAKVDICVIIINSAMLAEESFFANFGIMIFDEVHEYCGKERSKVFWKCQAPVMLGLSATTDEHIYKWDKIYYKHVGDVVFAKDMAGYDPLEVKFTGSVKIIKYHGPPGFTENKFNESTGFLFTPEMHNQAMNDTCRNMLIVTEVIGLYVDRACERNIFIFFEMREHVEIIVNMLRRADIVTLALKILAAQGVDVSGAGNQLIGDVFAPEVDMMRGSTKQDEIDRASKSRIIVTTYGYSKTGVSIIRMNSLIIGTSRKSKFKQTLARVMRLRSDYSIERKFIDIVDWDTAMKAQHYERRKAFVFYELTMNSIDVSWEDYKEVLALALD